MLSTANCTTKPNTKQILVASRTAPLTASQRRAVTEAMAVIAPGVGYEWVTRRFCAACQFGQHCGDCVCCR